MPEEDWSEVAKGIIKAQLARRNIKQYELARALNGIGVEETQSSISSKLSRGTFSFAFFLQCMYVLRINTIDLNIGDN